MITTEEKILNKIKDMLLPYVTNPDGTDNSFEIHDYNEAVVDAIYKVEEVIESNSLEHGQAKITVGFLGGTETYSSLPVNEAIEILSSDYSPDLAAVDVPEVPIEITRKIDKFKFEEKQIYELFNEAEKQDHKEWAKYALENSDIIAQAWITY